MCVHASCVIVTFVSHLACYRIMKSLKLLEVVAQVLPKWTEHQLCPLRDPPGCLLELLHRGNVEVDVNVSSHSLNCEGGEDLGASKTTKE